MIERVADRIHDALFTGIELTKDEGVVLTFELVDHTTFKVIFKKVSLFRCDEFLHGNIVYSLYELDSASVRQSDVTNLFWRESPPGAPEFAQVEAELTDGARFFHLESVYGASAWILCTEIGTVPALD